MDLLFGSTVRRTRGRVTEDEGPAGSGGGGVNGISYFQDIIKPVGRRNGRRPPDGRAEGHLRWSQGEGTSMRE